MTDRHPEPGQAGQPQQALPSPTLEDLRRAKRILCVQPHYDDNDIAAGGTLADLHDGGAELIYLTVTDDLVGVLDTELSVEQAAQRVRADQQAAGEIIGVSRQIRLEYPDAGEFSYFELRRQIVRWIRTLRPDFILTCDPWLPYEAHQDHIRTGLAAAEALLLYNLPRYATEARVDRAYEPYDITGIAFYLSPVPNLTYDITRTRTRKRRALACYQAQFTPESLAELQVTLEAMDRQAGQAAGFEYGEPLKLLSPGQLHLYPQA